MAKPSVTIELTESELRALFNRMDRHPSIRGKVVDAMERIRPVKTAHNRAHKAKRMQKRRELLEGTTCTRTD